MKFKVEIVQVGELVEEFLGEKMLILFKEGAPADLAEISVIHSGYELVDDIAVGDKMSIGDFEYKVTGVGNVANETLRDLGHCTLRFDGSDTPELPGTICLEGEVPKVKIGDKIQII